MRLSSMFFAVLLLPLVLPAQNVPGSGPVQIQIQLHSPAACPVGFSVDRKPDGAIIWTNSSRLPAPHGQGLDINFARPKAQIASADIVVHGYPSALHIIPAAPSAPSEITETFHLTANTDQPLLHPSVWTAHMVAISWVELTRLDYTDGTAWQPSASRQCTAAPSLFVPVATAR
ncbi:MAG: hypothetical protein ABSG84_15680 [Acidobacteriaceae bacterium]|jgi:hypothetical protein